MSLEKKVDDLNLYVRKAFVKIMGDDEDENSEGRLPRLETACKDHERRIRHLENLVMRGGGILFALWALVKLGVQVAEALKH